MSNAPLLSVIIPAFNSSSTIGRTLDSLKHQTFGNYEILLADALSSDETVKIAKEYLQADLNGRLIITSEKDQGIYDAMNKSIERAKGEWLYFLGSDDYLFDEHVLESLKEHFKNNRLDVIYGNVFSPVYGEKYDGEFDKAKILKQNIAHQSIFYRKGIFGKLGNYNTKYKMLADWDFNLRWFNNKGIRRKYVNLTVAFYTPGGKSEQFKDEAFYGDMKSLLSKYGYYDHSLKAKFMHFVKKMLGR